MSEQNNLPNWLKSSKIPDYEIDKDSYADKSIAGFLKFLTKITNMCATKHGILARLNPNIQMFFTLIFIILTAFSKNSMQLTILSAFSIIMLASLSPKNIVEFITLAIVVFIFNFAILLPSYLIYHRFSNIPFKIIINLMYLYCFISTTKFEDILVALKKLKLPDVFISTLNITFEYIYMLGKNAIAFLYSIKIRSVGMNKNKVSTLAGIGANLFFKSKIDAQDLRDAMVCRGFDGKFYTKKFQVTTIDYIFITVCVITIILYFLGK